MCGAGSSRIAATARATSTDETGEVLLAPIGSASSSASLTLAAARSRKKPSRKTVGRTVTTGSPDHNSACSAVQLVLRGVGRLTDGHLRDGHLRRVHKSFDAWCRATAAVLIVASRYAGMTYIPK